MNVDCPGERYYIDGLKVTRMDSRGSRDFSIYWDQYKQQWQWGMHGRLSLQWLGDNMIAWVPECPDSQCYGKVWRWQRCVPTPPSPPPPARQRADREGDYGPSRRGGGSTRSSPYSRSWRYEDEPASQRRSYSSGRHRGHSDHRGYRDDYRSDYRSSRHYRDRRDRDHRDHRDRRDYRHRWSHSVVSGHASERLPCGLTVGEVCSLLTREIRPEDYDLLLRLDETVEKPTASKESVEGLPEVSCKEFMGEECTVCLSSFCADESVVALPCRHHFHSSCIKKWLTECRRTCPLCGASFAA